MRHLLPFVAATVAATNAATAQLRLTHLLEIDIASAVSGIGNNPSAIAWNGNDLWVAGFNGSVNPASVAINKLSNALSPTATWGTPFGVQPTCPVNRGYSNLAVDPVAGRVFASYDPGTTDPLGLACYDLNGNLLWSKSLRGGAGAEFDPGFPTGNPALGAGGAWCAFQRPGRGLQDAATGADIWNELTGMLVQVNNQGDYIRDIDFDPATGDIYVRSSNNVFVGRRTGDNTTATAVLIDVPDANFVNQQNIAVLHSPTRTMLIYNDRALAATNQPYELVILAARIDGTPEPIEWNGFVATPGAGAYDFSYDAGTNTLVISDYIRRKADVFQVAIDPWINYGAGCPGQGAFVPRIGATGSVFGSSGGAVTYAIRDAAPLSLGFFIFGFGMTQVPLGNGCDLLVDPFLSSFWLGPFFTGPGAAGSGTFSGTLNVPPGFGGYTLSTQGVVLENANINAQVLSDALFLRIPQ